MSFLIVDMKHGGMDGFYSEWVDAYRIAAKWKKDLCHDQILILEASSDANVPISSYCSLSSRRINGGLHGPRIEYNAKPPEDFNKRRAITICSELLRDLYASDYANENLFERSINLSAAVLIASKSDTP